MKKKKREGNGKHVFGASGGGGGKSRHESD